MRQPVTVIAALLIGTLVACAPPTEPPRDAGEDAGQPDAAGADHHQVSADAGLADAGAEDVDPFAGVELPCARRVERLSLGAVNQQRYIELEGEPVLSASSSAPEIVEAIEMGGLARLRALQAGSASVTVQGAMGQKVVQVEAVLDASPFASAVVEVQYGEGAGWGQELFPEVVLGPPQGGGAGAGSLHVLSLGLGGHITLELGVDVVDGPGPDLIVFENPFTGFFEPARVEVSLDGVDFTPFPCASEEPYAGCAGIHTVQANPNNTVDPTDPRVAGGDLFDLADLGLERIRFVRIVDSGGVAGGSGASGFDLDAVVAVHARRRDASALVGSGASSLAVNARLSPRFDLTGSTTVYGVLPRCSLDDTSLATLDCDCSLTGLAAGSTTLRARLGDLETSLSVEVTTP